MAVLRKITAVMAVCVLAAGMTACSLKSYTKEDVRGQWHSDDVGGDIYFSDDDNIYLIVKNDAGLNIDKDGGFSFAQYEMGSDACKYDGETYSVGYDFGFMDLDLLTLRRLGEPSDSVYGRYKIESGVVFDKFTEKYGDVSDRVVLDLTEDGVQTEVKLCGYEIKGNKIRLSQDDLAIFGVKDDDLEVKFSVKDNELKLKSALKSFTLKKVEN